MSALFGEVVAVPQHGGPDINLRVYGDEFYVRYETLDGCTVVEDERTGLFSYADIREGRLHSTGIAATEQMPDGLPLHALESSERRQEVLNARHERLHPGLGSNKNLSSLGRNGGLLPGRQLHRGEVLGLTILVDFADVQTAITTAEVEALLNDEDYSTNGNACSLREYFRRMSGGTLNFRNEVKGPFKLSNNRSYYHDKDKDLIADVLEAAHTGGVDFSHYVSRTDQIVDSIIILYAGKKEFKGDLWPATSTKVKTYNGVTTGYCLKTGLGEDATHLRVGALVHEAGHLLCRFPDLYDYGDRDGNEDPSFGLERFSHRSGEGRRASGSPP